MKRRRALFLIVLCVSAMLLGCATIPPQRRAAQKKIIELGWGDRDTAFVRRHIAQMEQMPFDGVVLSLPYHKPDNSVGSFMWECWSKRTFTDAELASAIADLHATEFRRFTDNFVRFNIAGTVDWFDDFSTILNNARLAARIARAGKCKGIFLDTEQYNDSLFEYSKLRDAETKSWGDYAAQTRQRGKEVMEAFQSEYPDITIFLTFGYSLRLRLMEKRNQPLLKCEYGLLPSFLDGMVDAANDRARIVDGHELSYGYRNPQRFHDAYRRMSHDVLPIVADPEKYASVFSFGFGLWLDYRNDRYKWDTKQTRFNYFTPRTFKRNVIHAMRASDEYVWIYSQKPRWWTEQGGTLYLPKAYIKALREAREP